MNGLILLDISTILRFFLRVYSIFELDFRERSNKRRIQDIVREFSLQCRGIQGTEYSAQMNLTLV